MFDIQVSDRLDSVITRVVSEIAEESERTE